MAGAVSAGKSTLARQIGSARGLPYVEMDGLYHGPGWEPRPTFRDDVIALAASDEWVTEWQYTVARPLLAERTDLLVFLDLPRWLVTARSSVGLCVGYGSGPSCGTGFASRPCGRS